MAHWYLTVVTQQESYVILKKRVKFATSRIFSIVELIY